MNEIRTDKIFQQQSHAGEANLVSQGMVKYRLPMVRENSAESWGRAAAELKGAAGAILDLKKQIDADADDMELVKLKNFAQQRMNAMAFPSTEEEANAESAKFRGEFETMLKENKRLSARGMRRASALVEESYSLYQTAALNRQRQAMIRLNISDARDMMEQAVEAGDVNMAAQWHGKLSEFTRKYHGADPDVPIERIKSKAAANAMRASMKGYGIGALRQELEKLDDREKDGRVKGLEIIESGDLDQLGSFIRRNIAEKISAGADRLEAMRADGTFNRESVRELYLDGEISHAQYNQSIDILEGQRREAQYRTAFELTRELDAFDPAGMTAEDLAVWKGEFEEKISGSDVDYKHAEILRRQLNKMFRPKTGKPFNIMVETPEGKIVTDLLKKRYESGAYAFRGEDSDGIAARRYLEITRAARQFMEQGLPVDEVIRKIDELNEKLKEGEIDRILSPGGRPVDPNKWGKVFDSRNAKSMKKLDHLRKTTWRGMLLGGLAATTGSGFYNGSSKETNPELASRLKEEGYIDQAEVIKEKDASGREVWKSKNGSIVYADEYQ